ncbi:hypothetical protein RND81_02G089300 [Saponaria officinalis]|uniref:rRNA N-glycosidase n=1 Tax=Saponaria officinalis TaxID=3572 RepID=A0AAW1MKG6_SAPOF
MDVTLNLNIPEVDPQQYQNDPNLDPFAVSSKLFWEKYENFLTALRDVCTAEKRFNDFRITKDTFRPPLSNVILEANHPQEGLISVTLKCERSTVYFMAARKGRGEPQRGNAQNNFPWRECDDYDLMPRGTPKFPFKARYNQNARLGVGTLGFMALRNAMFGLYMQCLGYILVETKNQTSLLCVSLLRNRSVMTVLLSTIRNLSKIITRSPSR